MVRVWRAEHLPSGLTRVHVFIGVDRIGTISMETKDFWKRTPQQIDEIVRLAITEERPPVRRK